EKGASLMLSKVPFKPAPYASIKSCNYLFNVMMKKETIDAGFDFCVGLNGHGQIAEGPTENIMILDSEGRLCAPKFDYTLRGTTLMRMLKLAENLKGADLDEIVMKDVTVKELTDAREVMMVG